jgi:adenylate cyclase
MAIISPAMSDETEVAVLFADVVGSTRLYELLGDHAARDMIVLCVDLMRQATERNRGTVVKTIGDEILAIFPTGNDAVNAAAEMQHDIGSHPSLTVDGHQIAIRVGCHFGPVVLQDRDIFGSSVHTANRMTSQAKAGQIILTADTVRRLSPEWKKCTRQIDVAAVRGRSEEMELFEVLWQQEDATNMLPSIALGAKVGTRARRLRLSYLGHARIEVERNRFVLIDQSTNGTFVTTQEGRESFARRDSVTLEGRGMIGLGRLPEPNAQDAIHYRLED